ncbi:hypothetical protein F4808DRAFT_410570 [Astrocystis sublimbata]|nr:hypothetical protein F4808DRAFT_410570 [Astrocystis sublimbata]
MVGEQFSERDLLTLAATKRDLYPFLTRRAFRLALTKKPYNHTLQPVSFAIQNGDIPLFSRIFAFLDGRLRRGWSWRKFFGPGVRVLLTEAAQSNADSLQYLIQKYPLVPGKTDGGTVPIPQELHNHGFYTSYRHDLDNLYYASMVDQRNSELVYSALAGGRFDCAHLLLDHHPPLFPDGFQVRSNMEAFSSPATLNFLIAQGANYGPDPLHTIAVEDVDNLRVFDALVQRGFGVDAPRDVITHASDRVVFTPLYEACRTMRYRNIGALLQLGANPNGTSRLFIRKAPYYGMVEFQSPSPLLTLLLTGRWDIQADSLYHSPRAQGMQRFHPFDEAIVLSFRTLVAYGADILIPGLNGDVLEILLLRIWRLLCRQMTRSPNFSLPVCPDKPSDQNTGVQGLLVALGEYDCQPWDQVCDAISSLHPTLPDNVRQVRNKERLLVLLNIYQDRFGDLPGPNQLVAFDLPDRYGASTNIDASMVG